MEYYSNSQLNTYTQCGLKYYFHYVKRHIYPSSSPNLAFGSAIHRALEYFHRNHKLEIDMSKQDLLDMFIYEWEISVNDDKCPVEFGKLDNGGYITIGLDIMRQYYDEHKDDNPPLIMRLDKEEGRLIPAVELPFSVKIADDIPPIRGFIDLISFDDKKATVIDHKTSGFPYTNFVINTDQQLVCYSYAFKELMKKNTFINPLTGEEYTNKKHTTGFNVFIKKPGTKTRKHAGSIQFVEKRVTAKDIAHYKILMRMMNDGINKEIFMPQYAKPYERHCSWCDYKVECEKHKFKEKKCK